MEVKGKIIHMLDPRGGTSKAGNPWKIQEYVLETADSYPKKICFDFFGDKVDQFPLSIGDTVTISFDIESREFNGRWYTSVRAWKAEKDGAMSAPTVGGEAPIPPQNPDLAPQPTDDLPF